MSIPMAVMASAALVGLLIGLSMEDMAADAAGGKKQ